MTVNWRSVHEHGYPEQEKDVLVLSINEDGGFEPWITSCFFDDHSIECDDGGYCFYDENEPFSFACENVVYWCYIEDLNIPKEPPHLG